MLLSLIPFFDNKMNVSAYSFFIQKDHGLSYDQLQPTRSYDGAANILALETIQNMGIDALTGGKPVFVTLNRVSIFADVENQCSAPHDLIIFLFDYSIPPEPMYAERMRELKEMGYRLAVRKLTYQHFEAYKEILGLMDYILLDDKKLALLQIKRYLKNIYPSIKIAASNIDTVEIYESIVEEGFDLYEGKFYRLPLNRDDHKVSPLKVNYIQLLNLVNDENFELSRAADIIQRDTALTISMLRLVNSRGIASEIKSVQHAAAMLGQKELKKWINAAVTNELCSDKPNEVTKLSLIRAKFAENLAPVFEMALHGQELFLLGLFSVLDVILEMPISDALQIVKVTADIRDALVEGRGRYAEVYSFIRNYETAQWQEISRQLILNNIAVDDVQAAYMDTLKWYSGLIASLND